MYARVDKIFAQVPIWRLHNIQFITRTTGERVIKEQTKKGGKDREKKRKRERRDLILLNDNRYDSRGHLSAVAARKIEIDVEGEGGIWYITSLVIAGAALRYRSTRT